MKPYRFKLSIAILMIVLTQLSFALNPTVEGMITTSLMQDAMDIIQGVPGAHVHFETILGIMLLLLGLYVIKTVSQLITAFFLTDAIQMTMHDVRNALQKKIQRLPVRYFDVPKEVVSRPPALCQGCGHRDVYTALNEVVKDYPNARVFADIGCYTLGALPPFRAIDTCLDMGASITMAKGAADAGVFPAIAVIGDSTFTHSGMTGLLDAVNDKAQITVVISDNLTTAMTGGQDSAGTNKFEAICLGLGVEPEHVRVVVPLPKNMEEITRILREEIEYKGVSVVIPRRECIQTLNRKLKQKKSEKKS